MNKELRLRQSETQKVFWISDTHLNHDPKWKIPLWEARGFNSAKEHADGIINKINELVRPTDILIHAGDFCLNTDESGCNELLARINCQNIFMLWGNHNNPLWKIYQREVASYFSKNTATNEFGFDDAVIANEIRPEIYPFRHKNVVFLGNYVELTVDGKLFVVEHYPIHVFNYMKDGARMICGHSHYNLPFSQATNLESKILDIGWDGFGKPLTTEEILVIMDKKKVFQPGDHHTN